MKVMLKDRMLELEKLQKLLSYSQITKVIKGSGFCFNTLRRIREYNPELMNEDIRLNTLIKLTEYFRSEFKSNQLHGVVDLHPETIGLLLE